VKRRRGATKHFRKKTKKKPSRFLFRPGKEGSSDSGRKMPGGPRKRKPRGDMKKYVLVHGRNWVWPVLELKRKLQRAQGKNPSQPQKGGGSQIRKGTSSCTWWWPTSKNQARTARRNSPTRKGKGLRMLKIGGERGARLPQNHTKKRRIFGIFIGERPGKKERKPLILRRGGKKSGEGADKTSRTFGSKKVAQRKKGEKKVSKKKAIHKKRKIIDRREQRRLVDQKSANRKRVIPPKKNSCEAGLKKNSRQKGSASSSLRERTGKPRLSAKAMQSGGLALGSPKKERPCAKFHLSRKKKDTTPPD